MLLFEDILAQDELCSDAYPMYVFLEGSKRLERSSHTHSHCYRKLVDDIVYEVDAQMITMKEGDVDIGANASAEGGDEALEEGAVSVNNIVYSFRLQATQFANKASYLTYLKVTQIFQINARAVLTITLRDT